MIPFQRNDIIDAIIFYNCKGWDWLPLVEYMIYKIREAEVKA